jgi:hypothetical protein
MAGAAQGAKGEMGRNGRQWNFYGPRDQFEIETTTRNRK